MQGIKYIIKEAFQSNVYIAIQLLIYSISQNICLDICDGTLLDSQISNKNGALVFL